MPAPLKRLGSSIYVAQAIMPAQEIFQTARMCQVKCKNTIKVLLEDSIGAGKVLRPCVIELMHVQACKFDTCGRLVA